MTPAVPVAVPPPVLGALGPHYWDHVLWVWGRASIEDFMSLAADVNLDGVVEHIGLDHLPHVSTCIADWTATTFAELAAARG